MESIVSLWFVYLLSIADAIIGVAIGVSVAFAIVSVVYIIGTSCITASCNEKEIKEWKIGWGIKGKLAICLFFFSLFLAVFLPSKNSLIAMYVANEVTYERLGKAGDITREIKDELKGDVMDILNLFIENKDIKTKTQQSRKGDNL